MLCHYLTFLVAFHFILFILKPTRTGRTDTRRKRVQAWHASPEIRPLPKICTVFDVKSLIVGSKIKLLFILKQRINNNDQLSVQFACGHRESAD